MKTSPLARYFTVAFFAVSIATGFAAGPNAPVAAQGNAVIKLAAVGDSITAGSGLPNSRTDSYPAQLGLMLGQKWQVRNCGVSGATLLNHGDKPWQKNPAFPAALALNPDVVVIMLGTNDTKVQNWSKKGEFIADYKDLIGKFKALASNPRIFICYPPFVFDGGAYGINEPGVIEQLPMIDQIAREENVGIIDMHSPLKDKPELSKDHVHPKFDGAALLARAVYKALTGSEYSGPAPTPGPTPVPKPKPTATAAPAATVAMPSASPATMQ